MRHVEKALLKYNDECKLTHFIQLKNVEDIKGVAPIVSFTIQFMHHERFRCNKLFTMWA